MIQLNNGAISRMSKLQQVQSNTKELRVAFTARLSLDAYDAISQIQRQHRIQTGRTLPIWKVIDEAVKSYAKKQNIKVGE